MIASGEACAAAAAPVFTPWLASCIWIMIISFGDENRTCPSPERPPIATSKPIGSLPTRASGFSVRAEGQASLESLSSKSRSSSVGKGKEEQGKESRRKHKA
eukprot:3263428-Rhodomonas_salina.3